MARNTVLVHSIKRCLGGGGHGNSLWGGDWERNAPRSYTPLGKGFIILCTAVTIRKRYDIV